jgi:hypothetical protein
MAHCPVCNSEYRDSVTHCPDCGVELREGPPPASAPADEEPVALVTLCTVSDPSEAEVIQATLAEAGIPASVRRHGPITGDLARVTDGITEDYAIVSVPEHRLVEARELLEEIRSGHFEWPEGMEPDEDEDDEEEDE